MANSRNPGRTPRSPVAAPFSFDPPATSDDWDDEDDDVEEDGTRRTHVDYLPAPPEIDGSGGYTEIDGESANHIQGRSSSPRLFVQGSGHQTVTQLKVFRMENGVPVSMGAIDAEATEADLVRQFFNAMPRMGEGRIQFRFRPIDSDNRELGVESSSWISENHSDLQRLRVSREAPPAPVAPLMMQGGLPGMPPEIFSLMTKTLDRSHATVEDERIRSRAMMDQIANERVGLAQNVTSSIQTMSERLLATESERARNALEAENNRNRQASDSMAAFFQSQLEMMAGSREADRIRLQNERETEAVRAERIRKEEQERADRERVREQQRLDREQADWQRRLQEVQVDQESKTAQAIREAERSDQRRREEVEARRQEDDRRWQREMALMTQQREIEREETRRREEMAREELRRREEALMRQQLLEREERDRQRAAERDQVERQRIAEREEQQRRELAMQRDHEWRLKQIEIEAELKREHDKQMGQIQQMQMAAAMQAATGAKTDLKSLLTEGVAFLTAVGVDPKELVQRFISPPAPEPVDNTSAWADLAGKVIGSVGEVAKAKMITDASKERQGRRQRMLPGQGAPRALPDNMPSVTPGIPFGSRVPPGYVPAPTQYYQPPREVAAPVLAEPQPVKVDLPFQVQKAGRVGIRGLLDKLTKAPKPQWESIITVSLMENNAIYHYIQAVSLTHALTEAGASEKLIQEVVDALLENPLVPDDLNYGFDVADDDEDDSDDDDTGDDDDDDDDDDDIDDEGGAA